MKSEYRIKELCRQKGVRMCELANQIGYAKQSSLSQAMEHGLSSNRLIAIAKVLDVEVPELFTTHRQSITCPHCGKTITIKTED